MHARFRRAIGDDFSEVDSLTIGRDGPEHVSEKFGAEDGGWVEFLDIQVNLRVAVFHFHGGAAFGLVEQDGSFEIDLSRADMTLKVDSL